MGGLAVRTAKTSPATQRKSDIETIAPQANGAYDEVLTSLPPI